MPRTTRSTRTAPLGDTDPFRPTPERPVRVRSRHMAADSHFEPHRHAWGQLAYCASGVLQVDVAPAGGEAGRPPAPGTQAASYVVPPSRAVWIAPGALHAVTVRETAAFRTLYVDASALPSGWQHTRGLVVTPLLRELVSALDANEDPAREQLLMRLLADEIARAPHQPLAVPRPDASADKRLRALCDAVLAAPGRRATLAAWSAEHGASERTIARLFREHLGLPFATWRQQAVLAHALPLLARGEPVGAVADACGYASESAFSAMFKAAMGQPPRTFRGSG